MIKNNLIIKIIGYFLGGWALYYIYTQLKESGLDWKQINFLIQGYDYTLLVMVVFLYVIVMYLGAFIWSTIINSLSRNSIFFNLSKIILVHARSNIGKYIPGNFMQFVGRNILGHKLGYSHANLILSTALEVLVSIGTGMSLVLLILLTGQTTIRVSQFNYLTDTSSIYFVCLIGFLFLLLLFASEKTRLLLVKVNKLIQDKVVISQIVLGFISAYLILGVCNIIIYKVLDNELNQIDYFNFLMVYVFSWILGYIIPGPPGGLGVREVIYISLLSMVYDVSTVTLVAIILRIINLIGDLIYLVTAELIQKVVNK